MPPSSVFVATCVISAIASILIGLLSNYPIGAATGLTLSVYFTYGVVLKMGYPWQSALGAVFLSGFAFFLLTVTHVRKHILRAIPQSLILGTSCGIGLFIALIALRSAGVIVGSDSTLIGLGNIKSSGVGLFLLGFLLISVFDHFKVYGGILLGIFLTTLIGVLAGVSQFHGIFSLPPSMAPTFAHLQFKPMFTHHGLSIVLTFLLVSLFDSTGSIVGILHHIKFDREDQREKRIGGALLGDSIATMGSAVAGCSSISVFIESAAGIRAGGRTGLTSMVVAVCFLAALFFSPLAETIPAYATAPALMFVSILIFQNVRYIEWDSFTDAIPCVITLVMIPLTSSIADGLGMGMIMYVMLKALTGEIRALNPLLIVLAAIFVGYFLYMPKF